MARKRDDDDDDGAELAKRMRTLAVDPPPPLLGLPPELLVEKVLAACRPDEARGLALASRGANAAFRATVWPEWDARKRLPAAIASAALALERGAVAGFRRLAVRATAPPTPQLIALLRAAGRSGAPPEALRVVVEEPASLEVALRALGAEGRAALRELRVERTADGPAPRFPRGLTFDGVVRLDAAIPNHWAPEELRAAFPRLESATLRASLWPSHDGDEDRLVAIASAFADVAVVEIANENDGMFLRSPFRGGILARILAGPRPRSLALSRGLTFALSRGDLDAIEAARGALRLTAAVSDLDGIARLPRGRFPRLALYENEPTGRAMLEIIGEHAPVALSFQMPLTEPAIERALERGALARLEELHVWYDWFLRNRVADLVASAPRLRTLGIRLFVEEPCELGALPEGIETLHLRGILNAPLRLAATLPASLRAVDLHGSACDDGTLRCLAGAPNLAAIRNATLASDAPTPHLRALRASEEVSLRFGERHVLDLERFLRDARPKRVALEARNLVGVRSAVRIIRAAGGGLERWRRFNAGNPGGPNVVRLRDCPEELGALLAAAPVDVDVGYACDDVDEAIDAAVALGELARTGSRCALRVEGSAMGEARLLLRHVARVDV